jgi:hypothetical protein
MTVPGAPVIRVISGAVNDGRDGTCLTDCVAMMTTRRFRGAPQPNPPAENPDGTVAQPGSGHRAVGQLVNGFGGQGGAKQMAKKINGPVSLVIR